MILYKGINVSDICSSTRTHFDLKGRKNILSVSERRRRRRKTEESMAEAEPSLINQRWSLKGMTALVTGGTRGIGYAIVEELAGLGAKVHTCARNQAQVNERIREWETKGFKVSGSVCDLKSKEEREQLIKTVSSVFDGTLNILVNNAATITLKGALEYTLEDYAETMSTNVEAPYHLCQLGYPLLKASGNASIVFLSSIAGLIALPKVTVYAASKGAINQLTKNLAREWAKDQIRTNSVAPWGVNTTGISESDSPAVADYLPMLMRTPKGRLAEPNEISSMVAFLCLPAASYINGQVITIDSGFSVSAF